MRRCSYRYLDECVITPYLNQTVWCISPGFTDIGSQADFELRGCCAPSLHFTSHSVPASWDTGAILFALSAGEATEPLNFCVSGSPSPHEPPQVVIRGTVRGGGARESKLHPDMRSARTEDEVTITAGRQSRLGLGDQQSGRVASSHIIIASFSMVDSIKGFLLPH